MDVDTVGNCATLWADDFRRIRLVVYDSVVRGANAHVLHVGRSLGLYPDLQSNERQEFRLLSCSEAVH